MSDLIWNETVVCTYHGGIRPPSMSPCFCVCSNAHANVIGFFTSKNDSYVENYCLERPRKSKIALLETAPTAP